MDPGLEPVAVLTCHLCEEPVVTPFPAEGHTFCCHGCRELWRLLGEEEVARLKAQPGINWARLRPPEESVIPSPAPASGGGTAQLELGLDGLWCASCGVLVETVLRRTPGVVAARVDYGRSLASVTFEPGRADPLRLRQAVEELGYGVHDPLPEEDRDSLRLRRRFGVAAVLGALVMMFSVPVWDGYLPGLPASLYDALGGLLLALSVPVVFWSGWPFLRGAWAALTHRVATMDLLVALGSLSAFGYSLAVFLTRGRWLYFDTSALLITFLLLSRNLEVGSRNRAGAVMQGLARLESRSAARLTADGTVETVAARDLVPGDQVLVRTGGRIPADGTVREGRAAVDESWFTGEAVPVRKAPGSPVFAGSLAVEGRLVITVARRAQASMLAETARMVAVAQGEGNRWQRLADRVLRVFVPAVLALALLTFAAWRWGAGAPWHTALLNGIAVLIIACPCALSVATPVAVAAAAERLGRAGILLRSPDGIERAAGIDTVMLDKTGTLTLGRLVLEEMAGDAGALLGPVASLELASEHPVAVTLVEAARARGLQPQPAASARVEPGRGVEGTVQGRRLTVGRFPELSWPEDLAARARGAEAAGRTVVPVARDGRVAGLYILSDTLRPETVQAVARLRAAGLRVVIASGDGEGPVAAAARAAGITEWQARLSPLEKAERVRAEQAQGHRVAFLGDGINDAAALMHADLGIAMGAGADIARAAGHWTLVSPRLTAAVDGLEDTRKAVRIIRQNLGFSLVYNLAALPLAAAGWATPALAAAAMLASSASVLANALRVLAWSPRRLLWWGLGVTGAGALLAVLAWSGL
ncbi:MAG: cation-translocating P-type ATPase [Firmicutes bacterium]|nr:cation-translocating P-type ATPase [Bacillota bacterium]